MKLKIQSGEMSKLKQKIASYFNITIADLAQQYPDSRAKKFGEQKGVSFEMDLLVKTYCSVTKWASGEGFDVTWQTEENQKLGLWKDKFLSLHDTELECFLACLNDLKYFDE